MTLEQRAEAVRRVLAGETAAAVAAEFGVTRAYISLLKKQATEPERFRQQQERKLIRKLTAPQLEQLRETILASNPFELGLDPPTVRWTTDHAGQLAQRLFGKRPGVRVLKECLAPLRRREPDRLLRRPQPPVKHHISQLDPELAKNEEFVAYYLSPAAERLAWRSYELALADWQSRYGDVEYADLQAASTTDATTADGEWPHAAETAVPPVPPVPGQRVGKHAGSKGRPFTRSKKKHRHKRR